MADPAIYTVGWICALSIERVAVTALLDERHPSLSYIDSQDSNNYTLGRLGGHNVAVAVLPNAEYGTASAASVAKDMLRTFKNIRFGLLVGIGGGAPSPVNDIRLGDVVVSTSAGNIGGVFQYDYGKLIQDHCFEFTGTLNNPPTLLRTAVATLKGDHEIHGHQINETITKALIETPRLRQYGYNRPDRVTDILYCPDVTHRGGKTSLCTSGCSQRNEDIVSRPERVKEHGDDDPAIFYGPIASANKLMKDAIARDKLAIEKNIMCFETEAAGLMNNFSCIVIRGICDYADTHKNDTWQRYAAMTATAYAKGLLLRIIPDGVEAEPRLMEQVEQLQSDVKHVRSQVAEDAFHRWLAPPDPFSNHLDALSKRYPGSGLWLLNSTKYQAWKSTIGSTCWLQGMPGSGKTVLSSTIIKDLKKSNRKKCPVVFFFFDFNDMRKQSLDNAIRSLVIQMHKCNEETEEVAQSLYWAHGNGQDPPSSESLHNSFIDMIRAKGEVYLVLDALDECPRQAPIRQREKVLQWVQELCQAAIDQLHILVTSRLEPDIRNALRRCISQSVWISLDSATVSEDINLYIQNRIQSDDGLAQWRDRMAIRKEIESTLSQRANGMFRWVTCQLDEIQECRNERQLRDALASLPTTLDETYSKMLGRLSPRTKPDAIRLLQFLVYSERPLTIMEATEAIAIDLGRRPHFSPDRVYLRPEDLLHVCSGFVTVVAPRIIEDEAQLRSESIVQLAHFSVKEYFLSTNVYPELSLDFSRRMAHSVLGKSCIAYILYAISQQSRASSRRGQINQWPLFRFSACYWHIYAKEADADESMQGLAFEFYSRRDAPYEQVLQEFQVDSGTSAPAEKRNPSPVYYAAYAGQSFTCASLIRSGFDVNAHGGYHSNALEAASSQGHDQVVQTLLDAGAVDRGGWGIYGNALANAVIARHDRTVQLLLSRGANDDFLRIFTGYTLQGAAYKGQVFVVRALLSRGADIDEHSGSYGNALQQASSAGHDQVVQVLLDEGANVNAEGRPYYGSALQAASRSGHNKVINMLIDWGADLDAAGNFEFGTPLQAAICRGRTESVALLLRRGADINHQASYYDSYYGTALQAAAHSGHYQILQTLLQLGADVNAQGSHCYGNALQAASLAGEEQIVETLLEAGADVNAQGGLHGTALLAASYMGHTEIIQTLLSKGAHVNIQANSYYGTALQAASHEGRSDIVTLLLENGADVNAGGGHYGSALQAAAHQASGTFFILLGSGADINAQGGFYGTALQAASIGGWPGIVKHLLDRGADVNSQGGYRGNALNAALSERHKKIVNMLLDRGAGLCRS